MKKILHLTLILCLVLLTGCGVVSNPDPDANPQAIENSIAESEGVNASGGEQAETGQQNGVPAETAEQIEAATDIESSPDSPNDTVTDGAPKTIENTGSGSSAGNSGSGGPVPVEPQDADIDKKTELHCILQITCNTIFDNMDRFDQAKLEVLPENGVIYESKEIVFYEGESVFDVLLREAKENKVHMESVGTPGYNSNYVEGIGNIYEFDAGELSGWMYKVNDWFPNYGSSRYQLKDGDKIEWIYTCDLGRDIGGDWSAQREQ